MRLSKSDFKTARDCPAKLYYKKKRYPSTNDDNPYLSFLADGGYMVEAMAKLLFPEGVEMESWDKPVEAFEDATERILGGDCTLFEPTILHNHFLARVDILVREGSVLKLIEVKSTSVDASDTESTSPFKGARGRILTKWTPYLEDVTFQTHVLSSAFPDFTIEPYLCMVDKSQIASEASTYEKFILTRSDATWAPDVTYTGDPEQLKNDHLLAILDVSSEVESLMDEVVTDAARFATSLQGPEPKRLQGELSTQCKKCEYRVANGPDENNGFRDCWGPLAEPTPHVLDLFGIHYVGGMKHNYVGELAATGKASLFDISEDRLKGTAAVRQAQQIDCHKAGREWISPDLPRLLDKLPRPLHFIDFEGSRLAIPYHPGMSPYELAAFQWSCHTLNDDPDEPLHSEWLSTEDAFPNFEFARALKEQLGDDGTVFIYSPYETTTLKEIRRQMDNYGENDPDLSDWLDWMTEKDNPRVIDLLELAKEFYVHPNMKGSLSIKDVLPAAWCHNPDLHEVEMFKGYVERSESGEPKNPYDVLPPLPIGEKEEVVKEGTGAMRTYQEMMFGLTAQDPEVREKYRRLLLQYCKLDTAAMVIIWRHWINAGSKS